MIPSEYLGVAFVIIAAMWFATHIAGAKLLTRKQQRFIHDEVKRLDEQAERRKALR